jgi:ribosomal protein S18 acetylase RimI-like enzyme
MLQAEAEAIRRGCHNIVVDTHSFQAPGFYQKLGFEIVGVYPEYPRGHLLLNMAKKLTAKHDLSRT